MKETINAVETIEIPDIVDMFNGARVLRDHIADMTSALAEVTSAYENYRNNAIKLEWHEKKAQRKRKK